MQLIDTYQHIDKREILDCRVKSIKELVRHYGINLNSYEVFLLSEAFSFNYSNIKIPGISFEELPYATVSHNDLETTFLRKLNIDYQKEKIGADKHEWEYMKQLIDQGMPIMFKIDSRFLMRDEKAVTSQKKLNLYYLSTLLLVGYDEEKGDALIVLTNDDEKEDVNKITIEEFQKYRFSVCVPFSPDGTCFYIKKDDIINKICRQDVKKAILSSLKNITDIMLNKGENYELKMGAFQGSEVKKGIYGMQKLREDLQKLLDHYKNNDKHQHKIIQFLLIFLRNNMMFGSYTAFRSEFGKCIKHCADKYGILDFYPVVYEFEKISHNWSNLFSLLSSIAHVKDDLSEKMKMIINVWEKIIQAEQEQFTKIQEILSENFK